MDNWFTLDTVCPDTHIISEYRHWEETHCYLLEGGGRSLLIDTGLGICDISAVVSTLTDKPVTAVATLPGLLRPRGRAGLAQRRLPAAHRGHTRHGRRPLRVARGL